MRNPSSALLFWPRAALLAAFFLFLPGLVEQFEVPKAAAVLVLGAGGLGAALGAGAARHRLRWTGLDLSVLSVLAADLATSAFAASSRFSFLGNPAQRYGFTTSLALAGLYLAARLGTASPADAWTVLRTAFAGSAAVAVYALLQAFGFDPIPWVRTSAFGSLAMRPFATFGHPNLLGIVTGAVGAAALTAALVLPRHRALPAWTAGICTVTTVLTLSRGAWLGAALGCFAGVALAFFGARVTSVLPAARNGHARRSLLPVWLALTAAAAALLVASAGGWGSLLRERAAELISPGGSGGARLEIWRTAIRAWRASPWVGHGPDSFGLVFPLYQTPEYWKVEWGGVALHAHSIYFNTLAERGLAGIAAGLAAAVAAGLALRAAWCRGPEARALAAVLATGFAALAGSGAFGALGIGGLLLLTIFAALLAGLSGFGPVEPGASETQRVRLDHAPGRRHRFTVVTSALFVLVALAWAGVTLRASSLDGAGQELTALAERSRGESRRLAQRKAVQQFARAGRLDRGNDEIGRRHANALVRLALISEDPLPALSEAERQARRALALLPRRADNHVCVAEVLLSQARFGKRERVPEGEAAFARAMELAPVDSTIPAALARWEMDLGRPAQALSPAERALSLYPDEAEPLYQQGRALHALGERDRALRTLERAAGADWRGDTTGQRDAQRLLNALRGAPVSGGSFPARLR